MTSHTSFPAELTRQCPWLLPGGCQHICRGTNQSSARSRCRTAIHRRVAGTGSRSRRSLWRSGTRRKRTCIQSSETSDTEKQKILHDSLGHLFRHPWRYVDAAAVEPVAADIAANVELGGIVLLFADAVQLVLLDPRHRAVAVVGGAPC